MTMMVMKMDLMYECDQDTIHVHTIMLIDYVVVDDVFDDVIVSHRVSSIVLHLFDHVTKYCFRTFDGHNIIDTGIRFQCRLTLKGIKVLDIVWPYEQWNAYVEMGLFLSAEKCGGKVRWHTPSLRTASSENGTFANANHIEPIDA